MRKSLMLIAIIILLCGCDIEYNLDFTDNELSESISIKLVNNEVDSDELENEFNFDLYSIVNQELYDVKVDVDKDSIIGNYSYTYNTSNYKNANLINTCFEYFDFFEEDDKYYLVTNGSYRCTTYEYEYLDELTIKIKTNHNVIENNADEIKNGTYIWKITPDNSDDVRILFVTDKNISNREKFISDIKNYSSFIIAIILLSIIIAFIVFLVYTMNKKNNEI